MSRFGSAGIRWLTLVVALGAAALVDAPGAGAAQRDPGEGRRDPGQDVAGLGASPADVTINGYVDVYNRCLSPGNCIALNNFWRSRSNLTINVTGGQGCYASGNFWAVSQAAPMRRVDVKGGNLSLMDYCTGPSYASGGFIADSRSTFTITGSQQQWVTRDSEVGGGVVFSQNELPYDPPSQAVWMPSPATKGYPACR